jgi:hypothetical protein
MKMTFILAILAMSLQLQSLAHAADFTPLSDDMGFDELKQGDQVKIVSAIEIPAGSSIVYFQNGKISSSPDMSGPDYCQIILNNPSGVQQSEISVGIVHLKTDAVDLDMDGTQTQLNLDNGASLDCLGSGRPFTLGMIRDITGNRVDFSR